MGQLVCQHWCQCWPAHPLARPPWHRQPRSTSPCGCKSLRCLGCCMAVWLGCRCTTKHATTSCCKPTRTLHRPYLPHYPPPICTLLRWLAAAASKQGTVPSLGGHRWACPIGSGQRLVQVGRPHVSLCCALECPTHFAKPQMEKYKYQMQLLSPAKQIKGRQLMQQTIWQHPYAKRHRRNATTRVPPLFPASSNYTCGENWNKTCNQQSHSTSCGQHNEK